MEEIWDIYDSQKRLTGRKMKRNDWNMKAGDYHLNVLAVIKNSCGKFLVSKRAANKEWAALWWEFPGGGVRSGETSEEAVIREVFEETGLDLSLKKPLKIFSYKSENEKEKNNYIVDIYIYNFDFSECDIKIQQSEISDFMLATKNEIIEKRKTFLHFERIKNLLD